MTTEEFSNEIDIRLNSYAQEHPFGIQNGRIDITLNEYEKSVFLTEAQKDFVIGYYTGKSPFGESFEYTEEMRRALAPLVKTVKINSFTNNNKELNTNMLSNIIKLNDDVWYIVYESVVFSKKNKECINGKKAIVVPVTHDEVWDNLENPFKQPNDRRIFRLDIDDHEIELISKYHLASYIYRYIRKPQPIITSTLPSRLTIDGISNKSDCELNESVHSIILDLAVQKALQSKTVGIPTEKESK